MVGKVVELTMLDITAPESVEVLIDSRTLWVNVDGICRIRVSRFHDLEVKDERRGAGEVQKNIPADLGSLDTSRKGG